MAPEERAALPRAARMNITTCDCGNHAVHNATKEIHRDDELGIADTNEGRATDSGAMTMMCEHARTSQ